MKHYTKENKCLDCGKPIQNRSMRCKSCANKGKNNPNYKGGVVNYSRKKGIYRKAVFAPDNPMADKNGYVLRSRLVMSEGIGRPLEKEESVHHINSDKKDDRRSNLQLFANESRHQTFHSSQRRERKKILKVIGGLPKKRVYRAMSFAPSSFPSER